MQCVMVQNISGKSALILVEPQPVDLSNCSIVVGNYGEMSSELTRISPTEGAQIAGAILLVWAIGWAFRMVARSLNVDDKESQK